MFARLVAREDRMSMERGCFCARMKCWLDGLFLGLCECYVCYEGIEMGSERLWKYA